MNFKRTKSSEEQTEIICFSPVKVFIMYMYSLKGRCEEACVAEWLTPQTPDLEVRDSSLARRLVSLGKELYSTLSLFTQVYKWVPATYCWGVTLQCTSILSRGGVAILLGASC